MTVQYQGVWSLQSAAQLQSTQRWVTDPLYKNTTLLLQADDAANGAQNNTFLDSSSNSFIITRNGNTTQGSFTPFSQSPGWWGNYFDGSSGISTADSADFTFGSGNFTIQCWVFSTVGGSLQWLAGQGASNAANTSISFAIQKTANNKLNPSVFTGGTQYQITSTGDLLANQWVHIAFVRDGNTCRLYINGVQDGTVSVTGVTVNDSSNQVAIGQLGEYVTNRYTGYVSNFSIIKGTCSYPSGATFTVPASPLSASATNQSFLTCTANGFIDTNTATTAKTITVAGTPSVQAFSPFAPQFQWTPSVIGGSGYFDGTTDYLTAAGNAAFAFGTGDFTVAAWLYPTAATTFTVLSSNYNFSSGSGNWSLYFGVGSAQSLFFNSGSGNKQSTVTTTIPLNAWTHVAYTRVGTTGRFFVNGAQLGGTISDSFNYGGSSGNLFVGQQSDGTGLANGYMTSIQVLKGTGYSSLPIPTAPATNIANTSFLLNFTNAGIVDGTMKNNLETVGNAQISTAVVKYGSGSMYFDGTGDYLSLPVQRTIELGSADWTFETWVYMNTVSSQQSIIYLNGNTSGYAALNLQVQSGALNLWLSANGSSWSLQQNTIGTIAANAWNHIAVVKVGTNIKVYINGTNVSGNGYTVAASLMTTYTVNQIGVYNASSYNLNGYLDDMRLTLGIARYTQNFIPPSVALPRQ